MSIVHTPHSDLLDPREDDKECKQLTAMVVSAQLAGLFIISFALLVLRKIPYEWRLHCWLAVAAGFLGLGVVFWCWWELFVDVIDSAITGATEGQRLCAPLLPARRKARLLNVTLILVVLDTAIVLFLVVVTGGLGHSPFDPLLPVIPIIAIILKQPTRTVKWALWLQAVITVFAVGHWFLHWGNIKHPLIVEWTGYPASSDPNFILAFAIVAGGSILLSIGEYAATHGWSPLLLSLRPLRAIPLPRKEREAIKRGTKKWVGWLDSQRLPTRDMSLVHDPETVARQVVIRGCPALRWRLGGGSQTRFV